VQLACPVNPLNYQDFLRLQWRLTLKNSQESTFCRGGRRIRGSLAAIRRTFGL